MKKLYGIKGITLAALLGAGVLAGCGTVAGDQTVSGNGTGTTDDNENYEFVSQVTIEENGYTYNPEEIMYLAGITLTKYDDDKKFSLYDTDGDYISELFVAVTNGDEEKIGVYKYDETENCALLTEDVTYDIDVLVWASDNEWVDSNIVGVADIIGDPGLETDFYMSVNYDSLLEKNVQNPGDEYNPIDLKEYIKKQKEDMLFDTDNYKGDDIQLLRDYYDAATDWDKRDEDGLDPLIKYIDAVNEISTLDDVTEYLTDTENNPFNRFMGFEVTLDLDDTSEWALTIQEDNFSVLPRIYHNSEEEEIEAVRTDFYETVRYILGRLNYTDEEIDKILENSDILEDRLLEAAWPDEDNSEGYLTGFVSYEDVVDACENFPIEKLLNAYNVDDGKINLIYGAYLPTLDEMYTEENVEIIKDYLLTHLLFSSAYYLDFDTSNCLGNFYDSDEEYRDVLDQQVCVEVLDSRGILGVAEENAYMTYYVDQDVREQLTDICVETREAYREIIENEDWLSDEGKTAALEKLDAMTFSVLSPDTLIDSSFLEFDKDRSFLDIYATLKVNTMLHNLAFVGEERIPGDWRYDLLPGMSTSIDNAYYNGSLNQFFILAGFITDDTFRTDMTIEEKLGMFGGIIAHELTHGFDPMGIMYDKDGVKVGTDENPSGWLPEEDYEAFMERANAVSEYFDNIVSVPYMACTGEILWGEATADIGGESILLKMAEKYEDFDYDAFFKARAVMWFKQSTLVREQGDINEPHPAVYLRVNTVLQQFDEFYETYGITEGDLMYLAPEDRIKIW